MSKANQRPGWRPVSEVAELFGVSTQAFHKTYRPLLPKTDVEESGKHTLIRVRGLVDAWVEHRLRAEAIAAGIDPDMAGADSPHLERFRKWKADQEEIKTKVMLGTHIPRHELLAGLGQLFESLRRAIDKLVRTHGNEAGEVINRACEEAQRGWQEILKRDDDQPADVQPAAGAGGENPAAADPHDAPVRGGRSNASYRTNFQK